MPKLDIENLIEKHVNKVLNETFDFPKELNVYDFDDTLVSTEGTIHLVNNETGEKRELTPHEFHEYNLQPHEEFDLSDFAGLQNPEKLPLFKRIKSDYGRLGPFGVSICTARPDNSPVVEFMTKHGMPDIEVVAVGSHNPKKDIGEVNAYKKQKYLKNKIEQREDLEILRFFDDNEANCVAAEALQKEFPHIHMEIIRVT